jgi:glycine oxidase
LYENTGIDPEYRQHGMIIIEPENSPGDAWCDSSGAGRRESANALSAVEPALSPEAGGGFWLPEVAQVRNPRLLRALLARFEQLGGGLIANTEVLAISDDGVRTSGGKLETDLIIVCAGAWSSRLLPQTEEVAVRPIRGQMVLLKGTPNLFKPVIIKDAHYLIPRRDGRVVVGSTTEDVGFDKSTTAEVRDRLVSEATAIIPSLARLPVEHHWAGLRPCPPDGLPYVGQLPGSDRIWLNTGHYRNGLVMAPGSAELLVAQIEGRKPPVSPDPFQIAVASLQ